MIGHLKLICYATIVLLLFCETGTAQAQENAGLFDSEEILNIRLSGNIRELMKDKSDDMQYHPMTLSYKSPDSSTVSIPLKVKTRGNFRRTQGNCAYMPLMLNFAKEDHAKKLAIL